MGKHIGLISFKACQRCKTGDVVSEADSYGAYQLCVQCGHTSYPVIPPKQDTRTYECKGRDLPEWLA